MLYVLSVLSYSLILRVKIVVYMFLLCIFSVFFVFLPQLIPTIRYIHSHSRVRFIHSHIVMDSILVVVVECGVLMW